MSRADADKERATRNKLLGRYEGVDSPYIRRRVEELPPGQHKYVGDLVTLYRYVRGEIGGFAAGYKTHLLKQRYPEEYTMLIAEHRDELFEQQPLFGSEASSPAAPKI